MSFSDLKARGLTRLTMDVEVEVHSDIKARAAMRHTSVKNYVLEAIAMRMLREDQFTRDNMKRPNNK